MAQFHCICDVLDPLNTIFKNILDAAVYPPLAHNIFASHNAHHTAVCTLVFESVSPLLVASQSTKKQCKVQQSPTSRLSPCVETKRTLILVTWRKLGHPGRPSGT